MIRNLRFWCQKVLPLVYDDSLSYYELLCKVVGKLNEVINLVNVSSENIYTQVKNILDEWKEDGTLEKIINEDLFSTLSAKVEAGSAANIRQIMMSTYPYPTSSGARTDVTPSNSGAYYVQGFAVTPNGFAFVRLAPESGKINANDISQIFEFSKDGKYLRAIGCNVHHGNGMVYYDGYLYVDVGTNVAKVRYSDFTLESYIPLGGTCPALDRENKCIYSVDTGEGFIYRYDLETGAVSSVAIRPEDPKIYNGSFYKDGIFYAITYMNDLVMYDVETGEFLGGKFVQRTDANNIKLIELEDCDTDEQGNIYVLANQTHYATGCYDVSGNSYQLRRAGFYIGQLYLNGGASSEHTVGKHIKEHTTDLIVVNDATIEEAMNAKIEVGTTNHPFRSLAAASFFDGDVRQISCDGYTTMLAADIYQPLVYANYALISNLTISTTYPLAIKGFTGYIRGGQISITEYGLTLAYVDIASVDLDVRSTTGDYIGILYNGQAEIIADVSGSRNNLAKIIARQCELNGGDVVPDGACTTHGIKYTMQRGTAGQSVTITTPLLGGARGTRLGLLDRTGSKLVIYDLYGNTLYGTDGSSVAVTENDRTNGRITFIAPFNFDRVTAF